MKKRKLAINEKRKRKKRKIISRHFFSSFFANETPVFIKSPSIFGRQNNFIYFSSIPTATSEGKF